MASKVLLMAEMSWTDVQEALKKTNIVLLPVGSTGSTFQTVEPGSNAVKPHDVRVLVAWVNR